MKLPILYKKTSTGAIQFWEISVEHEANDAGHYGLSIINTRFGQLDTESPQTTSDIISKGKNPGKKNATTAAEQAAKEAQSKWEKQKKKGYVESIEAAQADQLDEIIEGGVVPMLAHKFAEQGHKIKYPCFVQPKLDGIRCIAIIENGQCSLWTRTRKRITSMPHIEQELEAAFGGPYAHLILDGELYNHEFKSNFEHIVSMVRQDDPHEKHTDVQYHVYDIVSSDLFDARAQNLKNIFETFEFYAIKPVETCMVLTEDDVMPYFDAYRKLGYEGAMLRNAGSKYVNKRSYDLLKVKEFDDAEFPITGIEEGRGKLAGHAIFKCQTEAGKEFLAKLKGETSKLKEIFENPTLWQGKKLTVQYQGLTGKEGVPRFPVGIAIRNYE